MLKALLSRAIGALQPAIPGFLEAHFSKSEASPVGEG